MSVLPVGIAASGDEAYTIEDSLRFRRTATGYLSRTPLSAGNQKTHTFSAWVKRGDLTTSQTVFAAINASGTNYWQLFFMSTGDINLYTLPLVTGGLCFSTTQVFRDPSAWYHVVLQFDTTNSTAADRVKLYINGERVTAFDTNNIASITLNADGYLNSAVEHNIGNRQPYGNLAYDGYMTEINFIDGQALTADDFGEFDGVTGVWKPKAYTGTYGTNGFYLPMTATTQAELQNSVLYTGNGSTQSITGFGFSPDLVWIKRRNGTNNHNLFDSVRGTKALLPNATNSELNRFFGSYDSDGFSFASGGHADNNASGGTYVAWAWDAGDNQPTTGISSVAYTGNGSTLSIKGFGFSPDLVWIKNRSSAYSHQLYDTVRGVTQKLSSDSTNAENTRSNALTSFDNDGFTTGSELNTNESGSAIVAWGWDAGDGDPVTNTQGSITSTVKANDATGFSIATYTVPSVGSTSFSFGHGLSTTPSFVISKARNATTGWITYHSSVGTGKYLTLNTSNAEATEANSYSAVSSTTVTGGSDSWWGVGQDYVSYCFSEVSGVSKFGSYTGNGNSNGPTITTGFRPGFVMIKRTDAAADWMIFDATRTPFNTADDNLRANTSDTEFVANTNKIDFLDNGFQIRSSSATYTNANTGTYIYMAFKGSYSDYVSPLNTDGTIDSRVKANPDKGFSIVSWEGSGSNGTIGHGLSSAPEFFFLKNRDTSVNDWIVYQSDVGATKFLRLNQTNATTTQSNIFNDTAPTSSVLSVGTNSAVNSSGVNYIAYCFHSVAGYSDTGTYTGTGSSGKAVTGLGFQPAWLMIKETSSTGSWVIIDTTRSPDLDAQGQYLWANLTSATGGASAPLTFDSDGFTINSSDSDTNASGQTYIYMAFADTRDAQFNFDASGNKNNWTPNNINSNASSETTYDLMNDVPTLTDEDNANFCTLSPFSFRTSHGAPMTLSEGNLKAVPIASTGGGVLGTMSPSSGKFYWECMLPAVVSSATGYGLATATDNQTVSFSNSIYYYLASGGGIYVAGTLVSSSVGALTAGDIISLAWDVDANELTFRINNSVIGTGAYSVPTTSTEALLPFIYMASTSNASYVNFGQRPFAYTPPTGFKKLNTYNLPDSTIEDGSEHFNTVLYTGNGSTQSITGVGFQPDFLWLKRRDSAENHGLHDAVRGSTKFLVSNQTASEYTRANSVTSFDSDGFSLGDYSNINSSGSSMVGWNWKANGSGVSNSEGDITVTVSADATSGFSIVKGTYTGAGAVQTFGHGLGDTPAMIINKDITNTGGVNWVIWHKAYGSTSGNTYVLIFNTNALIGTGAYFGTITPSLSCTTSAITTNNSDFVQYIWTEIEGFSKFGSYTGNGSADGPFIYTGFSPSWLLIKRADAAANWLLYDNKRLGYNTNGYYLLPDGTWVEGTGADNRFDLNSNGFKVRDSNQSLNVNTGTYIYAAFAENPFKNALAR